LNPSPPKPHFLIPNLTEIAAVLDLESMPPNYSIFHSALLSPLSEFLTGGGKRLRAEILEIGFLSNKHQLDVQSEHKLHICAQIIEGIHAGSMIIDDIQDQSQTRRGEPTLHLKHGIGLALNAGNWLYFQAIDQIQKLQLCLEDELQLRTHLNRIFLKAHFGQAVDLGTQMRGVPQEEVRSICLTSMELKTGALMSLAFDLGALIAGPKKPSNLQSLNFAKRFGIALQMFDDIGNFIAPPPKGKEDLMNGRPTWIWAIASQLASQPDYARFIEATQQLPNTATLNAWAQEFDLIPTAKREASNYLWNTLEQTHFDLSLQDRIENLFVKLENSYV
jgi:geranylgeranyl pyrophosphate synthase